MVSAHSDSLPFATSQEGLAHRIEEASLNAWPALQQVLLDGWVLRFARGFTKRSNCIVPVYPSFDSPPQKARVLDKIRYCENLYAREQLRTVFRLTSIPAHPEAAGLNTLLDQRGYETVDTSLVLSMPLTDEPGAAALTMLPLDRWLDAYCALTGMAEPARTLHHYILKAISGECGVAVLTRDHVTLACGLAVVERDLVGLFDIFTQPDLRGQGVGTHLVQGLLGWARGRGARRAYLQVVEHNAPANALYTRLGFVEMYRYWYRVGV